MPEKKRRKPYSLPHMVTVALSSCKLAAEEKPHLTSGWQQKRLSSIHHLQSNYWSISKTHLFSYKTPPTTIAETSRRRNSVAESASPKRHRRNVLDPPLKVECWIIMWFGNTLREASKSWGDEASALVAFLYTHHCI